MADYQPDYNVYFEREDIDGALVCLDTYGYCVIRKMIDQVMVQILKDAIDEALRRPGRFDREIVIGVPDESGRREILGIHTRGMPLGDKVDLNELAKATYGFVGADIAALAREAAIDAVRRIMPRIDLDERTIPPEVLDDLYVGREDFLSALKRIQPSAMREVMVQMQIGRAHV